MEQKQKRKQKEKQEKKKKEEKKSEQRKYRRVYTRNRRSISAHSKYLNPQPNPYRVTHCRPSHDLSPASTLSAHPLQLRTSTAP
jgi:hypothetical protein